MYKEKLKELKLEDEVIEKIVEIFEENLKINIDESRAEFSKQLKEKSEGYEKQIYDMKVDFYVQNALKEAKAKNLKATKALLDLQNIEFDEEGKVEEIDKQIKRLVEDNRTSFLFDKEKQSFKGLVPAEAEKIAVKPIEQMTYTELKSYYENGGQ